MNSFRASPADHGSLDRGGSDRDGGGGRLNRLGGADQSPGPGQRAQKSNAPMRGGG